MKAIAKMETPNILDDFFQVTSKSSVIHITNLPWKKPTLTALEALPPVFHQPITPSFLVGFSSDVDWWVDPKPAHWICSGYQGHHLRLSRSPPFLDVRKIKKPPKCIWLNVLWKFYLITLYPNCPKNYLCLTVLMFFFFPKNDLDMFDKHFEQYISANTFWVRLVDKQCNNTLSNL